MSKSGTHFHFKQFSVRHDRSTMKVGTDGVLLGAWVDVHNCKRILDIGTGSGVIALMLAQRTTSDVVIDAVEVEQEDAEQAKENVEHSPWPRRIEVFTSPIQNYKSDELYDLIVSNPPYFNNSAKPPDEKRIQARHTTSLPYDVLVNHAKRLLDPNGKLAVILPFTEGLDFETLAKQHNLFCVRKTGFRTRREKPVERWLMEFSLSKKLLVEHEILLYNDGLEWSDDYIRLTRDFYLKA
jgi:tRNA1Val (adenine37-N6)-methyltransferase